MVLIIYAPFASDLAHSAYSLALASREPDEKVLKDILERHELLDRWGKMIL